MPIPSQRFKRKKYFIAPAFQIRYIRVILLIMFGVGAISAYTVYYKSMIVLGEKLANVYPQGRLVAIVRSVNIQILLSLLLITPLVVLIGIFLSHRIAGPIYRIEKTLSAIAEGDIASRITLRKRDELKSLADGINLVIDSLRSKVTVEVDSLGRMNKEIAELEDLSKRGALTPDAMNAAIERLKEESANINKALSQYKL